MFVPCHRDIYIRSWRQESQLLTFEMRAGIRRSMKQAALSFTMLGIVFGSLANLRGSSSTETSPRFAREMQNCLNPFTNSNEYTETLFERTCFEGLNTSILDPVSGRKVSASWRKGMFLRENGFLCDDLSIDVDCQRQWNRHRQVGLGIMHAINSLKCCGAVNPISNVAELQLSPLSIWDTQSTGPFFQALRKKKHFVSSEYISEKHHAGDIVMIGNRAVRHENMMNTSFQSHSHNLIISTEVLEHVPLPYAAHAEVLRVLKPGGAHVFTVPFDENSIHDRVKARLAENGSIVHIEEPMYHGDPIRPEGALVFNIFGKEMVSKLCALGYETHGFRIYSEMHGAIGPGALVFIAIKAT
jgi:Methyltransferase domain